MKSGQGGFSYLFMLFMVALGGIMLVASAQTSWMESKRDKEAELLFAGNEFKKAIDSFNRRIPIQQGGGAAVPAQGQGAGGDNSGEFSIGGEYPRQLEDLLEDRRFTPTLRHLRRIYVDPLTGSKEWGLLREGGRIVGVYSRSADKPLKAAGFPEGYDSFGGAKRYDEWKFVATRAGFVSTSGVPPARADNLPGSASSSVSSEGTLHSLAEQSPASAWPTLSETSSGNGSIVPQPDIQPPNVDRLRLCAGAYIAAVRGCNAGGGNDTGCIAAAMASRRACLAGG